MDIEIKPDSQRYDVLMGDADASDADTLAMFRYAGQQTTVVPAGTGPKDVVREPGWRHIAIEADLPFDTIGFFRHFADALADAKIPILPFASFRYDHVLVPAGRTDDAVAALEAVAARLKHL